MQPYSQHFQTRHHEMDVDHLLRVQCLCNYMEEVAGNHADALGAGMDYLARQDLAWVLVKMRLELKRRPGPGEEVRVDTWPVSMERVQFRRDFIVYDHDNLSMATAVTQWVVMGITSRKLERFPSYIEAMEPENPPLAQASGDIRIPAVPLEAVDGPCFPVRLADIDQNLHVNNGRYVDFSLEAADHILAVDGLDRSLLRRLQRLDIIFRAEALRGDTITSKTMRENSLKNSFIHSLCRESDGQELARSRTVFAASEEEVMQR